MSVAQSWTDKQKNTNNSNHLVDGGLYIVAKYIDTSTTGVTQLLHGFTALYKSFVLYVVLL